jgi:hypothetical protein
MCWRGLSRRGLDSCSPTHSLSSAKGITFFSHEIRIVKNVFCILYTIAASSWEHSIGGPEALVLSSSGIRASLVFTAAPLLACEHRYRHHVTLRIPRGASEEYSAILNMPLHPPQDEDGAYEDGAMVRDDGRLGTSRPQYHCIPLAAYGAARGRAAPAPGSGTPHTPAPCFPQTTGATAALSSVSHAR